MKLAVLSATNYIVLWAVARLCMISDWIEDQEPLRSVIAVRLMAELQRRADEAEERQRVAKIMRDPVFMGRGGDA